MVRKKILIHLHHISTHFTNGLFPVASVMLTLYLYTGNAVYESTAFHCMVIGLLGIPVAYLTGITDWKKRFQGRRTKTFDHKIAFGIVFLLLALFAVFIRFSYEETKIAGETLWVAYIASNYILTGIVTYLGHLGSKFI